MSLRSEDTIRELVDGHTPAYWDALARGCPRCGAVPHRPCVTAAGKPAYPHGARYAKPQEGTS